eukprot:s857_g3.t4
MKSSLAICMRCFAGGDASCEATGIRGLLGPGLLRTSELRCSRGEDMRHAATALRHWGRDALRPLGRRFSSAGADALDVSA